MDLIGNRIKQNRELFGFLNKEFSTQIDIALFFVLQIVPEKKITYYFPFKKYTKAILNNTNKLKYKTIFLSDILFVKPTIIENKTKYFVI